MLAIEPTLAFGGSDETMTAIEGIVHRKGLIVVGVIRV
jgi:hypothetical protein